jgi:hypothetical protein
MLSHWFISPGKQAARAKPWATWAESSGLCFVQDCIMDGDRTITEQQDLGTHGSKLAEAPSAGIGGTSLLPFFLEGLDPLHGRILQSRGPQEVVGEVLGWSEQSVRTKRSPRPPLCFSFQLLFPDPSLSFGCTRRASTSGSAH